MKYKVGDKVRIKSLDWYNENKDKKGNVYFEGGEVKPCFSHCMSIYCGQIMTISDAIGQLYDMIEDDGRFCWVDEMIEGLVEEEIIDLTSIVMETVEEKTIQNALTYGYILPEGYQFVDENGNVINATKIVLEKKKPNNDMTREEKIENAAQAYIDSDNAVLTYSDGFCEQTDFPFVRAAFKKGVEWADKNPDSDFIPDGNNLTNKKEVERLFWIMADTGEVMINTDFELVQKENRFFLQEKKKKEYPKTFRECQECLGEDVPPMEEPVSKTHRRRQVHLLEVLLICRDAYWKIAGEEMGLGKPWEPNWGKGACYTICCNTNQIVIGTDKFRNSILAFPTEEMRDEFYENFKELINECKELL